jgi:hypothetical protein
MRIKQVGEHLTKSYEQWREYLSDNQQYTILKKELPKSIYNLKNKLNNLSDTFLGKYNFFHDVSFLKTKTKEMYERTKRFINIKEY